MKLLNLRDMPDFNPAASNGTDSITTGKIFFGRKEGQGGLETVSCMRHGAVLCVASYPTGRIWRCRSCNKGALEPR